MTRIITKLMLRRAVEHSTDFDSFIQNIVYTVTQRTFDFHTSLSPDDLESLVNTLYANYRGHYDNLVKAFSDDRKPLTGKEAREGAKQAREAFGAGII